jgi:hypothetical protein
MNIEAIWNAINNGQSRDTGNIEHKKANKNAINNGQSRDTGNIEQNKANKNEDKQNFLCSMLPVSLDCSLLIAFLFTFLCSMLPVSLDCPLLEQECNQ